MKLTKDTLQSRVKVDGNGCWKWQGATRSKTGRALSYGWVTYKNKQMGAHRASWIVNFGDIPLGMCVCHKCDVADCVNPEHLFIGTVSDNIRDMVSKGRKRTKLLMEDVSKIRAQHLEGIGQTQIAKKYNVSRATICLIVNNKLWRASP